MLGSRVASVRSNVTVENSTSVQFQICLTIDGEPDQIIALGAAFTFQHTVHFSPNLAPQSPALARPFPPPTRGATAR